MLDCQQGNRELGGFAVNDVREKKGLNPLDVHVVDVVVDRGDKFIHGKDHDGEEKMSSTVERKKLLGTLLRPVVRKNKVLDQTIHHWSNWRDR